jgi:hypothetical protein
VDDCVRIRLSPEPEEEHKPEEEHGHDDPK